MFHHASAVLPNITQTRWHSDALLNVALERFLVLILAAWSVFQLPYYHTCMVKGWNTSGGSIIDYAARGERRDVYGECDPHSRQLLKGHILQMVPWHSAYSFFKAQSMILMKGCWSLSSNSWSTLTPPLRASDWLKKCMAQSKPLCLFQRQDCVQTLFFGAHTLNGHLEKHCEKQLAEGIPLELRTAPLSDI